MSNKGLFNIQYDTIQKILNELKFLLHKDRDEVITGKYTFSTSPNLSLEGNGYIFVQGGGTPHDNAQELYNAIMKYGHLTGNDVPSQTNVKTIVVAPGEYDFTEIGIAGLLTHITPYVNIVSLTGNSDVFIRSSEQTPNAIVIYADNILLRGINCGSQGLYIDENAKYVEIDNCVAGGVDSFYKFGKGLDITSTLRCCVSVSYPFYLPESGAKVINCVNPDGSLVSSSVVSRQETSLDMMPQLFYRNLEGDNMLATMEFEGRIRPIETPIKFIGKDGDYYILANMPYIKGLVEKPTDWMFGTKSASYWQGINYSIKILTAEYIDDFIIEEITYTNCCKISLNSIIESGNTTLSLLTEGESVYISSFSAGGLYLKGFQEGDSPAFVASGVKTRWDGQIPAAQASWRCSDGTYRALVSGYGASLPNGKKFQTKAFQATDRFGDWTIIGSDDTSGFFDSLLPVGGVGFTQGQQTIPHPYKPGCYLMHIGVQNSSGSIIKTVIIEFNEYLTKYKLIDIAVDYTPEIGLSTQGYGLSIAFYKGNYLISLHDGNHITGKRIILQSKWLEGEYSVHSTMFDFTAQPYLLQYGSLFGESVPNSSLFVFNNELYAFVTAQPKGGFLSTKLEQHLMKFNDAYKTWDIVKGCVIMALHGDDNNYPEYPAISNQGVNALGGWAKAHIGQINVHYIEGNKLWIGYAAKGFKLPDNADAYHSSIGYIDLDKALS